MLKRLTNQMSFILCVGFVLTSIGLAADPALVGWWKLDETSGTVANGSSGRDKHGDLMGGASWGSGKIDGALQLDGQDDYVEVGAIGIGGMDVRTLTGWAKASTVDIPAETGVFGFAPDVDIDGTYFNVEVDGDGNYIVNVQGLDGIVFGAVDTQWHHFALTYDGAGGSWYLDGHLVSSLDGELGTLDQFRIGGRPSTSKYFPGFIDDVRLYKRVLTETEIQAVIDGSDLGLATEPSPADGAADVSRDVVLGWTPNPLAVRYDVYLGMSSDDVAGASIAQPRGVLLCQGQTNATCAAAERLEFGQTYHWRVDAVASDNTIARGRLWSFTTEPLAYAIEAVSASSNATSSDQEGPVNTINGSGLDENDQHSVDAWDMWLGLPDGDEPVWIQYAFDRVYKLHEMLVWNYNEGFELLLGIGLKNVTIEYSTDGADWASLGDIELAQGTTGEDYTYNTTVDFEGVAAKYVRLTVNDNFGMIAQYGLSEVRFLYIPAHARLAQPADGAADVAIGTMLSWSAGRQAVSHEVYFDADETAVVEGAVPTAVLNASEYDPGDLEFGGTYYWRVDEVNDAESIGVWEGSLWSFTVQEYAPIDDFESYTDDEGERIYQSWVDGYNMPGNGSQVGYTEAPFAEKAIVHGGRQAMPLFYDNAGSASRSEVSLTLAPAQDLTVGGANSLRLFFRGEADNTAAPLYVTIEDSAGNTAVVTHPDADAAQAAEWQDWTIRFADLAGVDLTAIKTVTVGIGGSADSDGEGVLYIDDVGFGRASGLRG